MKLPAVISLLPAVLALPISSSPAKRQTATTQTDDILFSISLRAFEERRRANDPPTLNWTSDGCSSSPDNPFGFPFTPACQRHDFGYRNYKAQRRFTDANRKRIDDNFRTDLYYICSTEDFEGVCKTTADVYYFAVRLFGGDGVSDARIAAAENLNTVDLEAYTAAVNALEAAVVEAKAKGLLP